MSNTRKNICAHQGEGSWTAGLVAYRDPQTGCSRLTSAAGPRPDGVPALRSGGPEMGSEFIDVPLPALCLRGVDDERVGGEH